MNPSRIQRLHCLTSELSDLGPVDQAERLCSAGARWIQFRMKDTGLGPWIEVAKQVRAVCRRHEATFVVNDSIEVALAVEADRFGVAPDGLAHDLVPSLPDPVVVQLTVYPEPVQAGTDYFPDGHWPLVAALPHDSGVAVAGRRFQPWAQPSTFGLFSPSIRACCL